MWDFFVSLQAEKEKNEKDRIDNRRNNSRAIMSGMHVASSR
jgi:hypothetical protein